MLGDGPGNGPKDGSTLDAATDVECGAALTSCTGQCIDLATDGKNCGTCGHDCLDGGCSAKQCQPFALAHDAQAWDLATDGTNLYWTDGATSVQKCAIASCTPTLVMTGQYQPQRVIADGTGTIYWTVLGSTPVNGEIWSYDGVTPKFVTGAGWPGGIAFDSSNLYWIESGNTSAPGAIMTCPRTGGSATPLTAVSTPTSVIVDSSSLYWTDWANGDSSHGSVQKCFIGAGPGACHPSRVVTGQAPFGLAVDATYVYWTISAASGSIWRSDHDGGGAVQLGGLQALPSQIVSDGAHIYWTNGGTAAAGFTDGSVMSCLGASCAQPTPIVTGAHAPSAIASDGKAVYYATSTDKTLWMLAK
jgi:hypothetical protein